MRVIFKMTMKKGLLHLALTATLVAALAYTPSLPISSSAPDRRNFWISWFNTYSAYQIL